MKEMQGIVFVNAKKNCRSLLQTFVILLYNGLKLIYKKIEKKLVDNHQYDLDGLRKVPQKWTADERAKRGLTKEELPDSFLTK